MYDLSSNEYDQLAKLLHSKKQNDKELLISVIGQEFFYPSDAFIHDVTVTAKKGNPGGLVVKTLPLASSKVSFESNPLIPEIDKIINGFKITEMFDKSKKDIRIVS